MYPWYERSWFSSQKNPCQDPKSEEDLTSRTDLSLERGPATGGFSRRGDDDGSTEWPLSAVDL
jgi:hypothetical protein